MSEQRRALFSASSFVLLVGVIMIVLFAFGVGAGWAFHLGWLGMAVCFASVFVP